MSTPCSSKFNTVIYQVNHRIMVSMRCLVDDTAHSMKSQLFAVTILVHLQNHIPLSLVAVKTPYEAWPGKKLCLMQLSVFRGLSFVQVLAENRLKLAYRATTGLYEEYWILAKQYFIYNPLAKSLHCSRDVIFKAGMQSTANNAANKSIFNENCFRDDIEEHNSTEKKLNEYLSEESMDVHPPLEPPKSKNKSRQLDAIEIWLGDALKLRATGSCQTCSVKGTLVLSVWLAFEDEVLECLVLIYPTSVITNDHQDGIDDSKSYNAQTESSVSKI